MNNAFEYIKQNDGIDSEKSYPYKAYDQKCRFKAEDVVATDVVSIEVVQDVDELHFFV